MKKRVIRVANKVSFGLSNMIMTSVNGDFLNSYSIMPMEFLKDGIKGLSKFNHAILAALLPYQKELMEGKQVDVHIEETRDKDFLSYEVTHVSIEETWELLEKLSSEQLIERFKTINGIFGKSYFLHKSGNLYYADKACTVNKDGRSWLGMSYYPVTKEGKIVYDIPHTRVMEEFASYRFVPIETLYDGFTEIYETFKLLANFTIYAIEWGDGTWSYSFLPFNETDFKDTDMELHTICIEDFLITNTTVCAETKGKPFAEVYSGMNDINCRCVR